jgi:ATP-dependent DNA helicase RecQ
VTFDNWACAQHILDLWPTAWDSSPARGTCLRLRDALAGLPSGAAGWRDIAALVRQVLLEHEARTGVVTPLRVRVDALLPSRQQWADVHCQTVPHGDNLSVTANWWTPPPKPEEDAQEVVADVRAVFEGRRPKRPTLDADPFWTDALNHPAYLTVGQRQAARSVVLAPAGSTTILSLPTGNGKTDVALSAALPASRFSGVSVVVVPTVVLALDMERRLFQLIESLGERHSPSRRYAYTAGLADSTKTAIRDSIRHGQQRVVFTSPEALASALNPAVYDAATRGLLRYFVIDEAHLAEQWGTEFRPEFQTIAAQLQTWRETAPAGEGVRTIAMSATLSDRQITTLCKLFAGAGPTALVWSSETRREPSYHIHHCADEADRDSVILQAVTMLPRPMILYVSTRADATRWIDNLRSAGMRRVAQVTGASSDADRRCAVERWRGECTDGTQQMTGVDVVVGTSAFGLGVDMANVRTIIHACQPETLDRFYQEVGRGGRDRCPSVAFITTTPHDTQVASALNRQTVIGLDKGWRRWQTMLHGDANAGPNGYEVNIDSRPPNVGDESEQNRQWNVRTLNLVQRAGLAVLRSPQPPSRLADEDFGTWQSRWERFLAESGSRVRVQILHGETNRYDHWAAVVDAERSKVLADQRRALVAMEEVLRGARCANVIVADYYRAGWCNGQLRTLPHCRGCSWCRAQHPRPAPTTGFDADPFPAVASWEAAAPDPLAVLRGDSSWLSLWWDDPTTRNDLLPDLLEQLVRRGMSVIGGPGVDADFARRLQRGSAPFPVIVDVDRDLLHSYAGSLIWVMDDSTTFEDDVQDRLHSDAITYLLHPRSMPARDRPGVRLVDVCPAPRSLRTALGAL